MGLYNYSNLDPDANNLLALESRGNLTVDVTGDGIPDKYLSDFTIVNPIASLTHDGWRWPLTFAGEYIKNTRAASGDDQGYAVDLSLGKVKAAREWKVFYQ